MSSEVFRNCFVCDYQAVTSGVSCPQCGKPLQSEGTIRFLGGVLSFLGLLLITMMIVRPKGLFGVRATRVVDRPGHYGEAARQGPSDGVIYSILIAVLLAGVLALLAGGWMVVTGRRNLKLLWLMITFGLGLGSVGYVFVRFL
jgi:hypothetical protein